MDRSFSQDGMASSRRSRRNHAESDTASSPTASRAGGLAALCDALRQAIVSGRLAPGARLTEAALETEFAADPATLADALGQLESRGLVVREPRRFWRVRGHDAQAVRQLYAVRALLEREAMAGLAASIGESGDAVTLEKLIADLSSANAAMEKRRDAGDAAGYLKANERFHAAVLRHAPNEPLRLVLELLNDMAAPLRMARLSHGLAGSSAVEEHAAIIEMLGADQLDAAVDAMQDHILGSADAAVAAAG